MTTLRQLLFQAIEDDWNVIQQLDLTKGIPDGPTTLDDIAYSEDPMILGEFCDFMDNEYMSETWWTSESWVIMELSTKDGLVCPVNERGVVQVPEYRVGKHVFCAEVPKQRYGCFGTELVYESALAKALGHFHIKPVVIIYNDDLDRIVIDGSPMPKEPEDMLETYFQHLVTEGESI